ncbi:hypothetical protein D910_00118, partial [Dendroctonus ponderosae]
PAAACVPPCDPNIAPKQCLHFLQELHKDELCGRDLTPGRRRAAFADLRLRHCYEHRVAEALPEAAFHDTRICRLHLQDLLHTDDLALQASCHHADLLLRYDCAQTYSIVFTCEDCKPIPYNLHPKPSNSASLRSKSIGQQHGFIHQSSKVHPAAVGWRICVGTIYKGILQTDLAPCKCCAASSLLANKKIWI